MLQPSNPQNALRIRSPTSPLFSGWNWVPYTFPLCTAAVRGAPYSVQAVSPLSAGKARVGVDEIDVLPLLQSRENGAAGPLRREAEGVPAHVGHGQPRRNHVPDGAHLPPE